MQKVTKECILAECTKFGRLSLVLLSNQLCSCKDMVSKRKYEYT